MRMNILGWRCCFIYIGCKGSFTGIIFLLPLITCMCPMSVAFERGGYFLSCFVVNVENIVRYTDLIGSSSVEIFGEKKDE